MRALGLLVLCTACSVPQLPQAPAPQLSRERLGYTEHLAEAERHDVRAAEHERAATMAEGSLGDYSFDCGDVVLNDQLTTGGLRVTLWTPCLDLEWQAKQGHRRAVKQERREARRERRIAGTLVADERAACAGRRGPSESPFARRESIARIDPVYTDRADRQVSGVRVLLHPTAGMTAESLTREIACQRATWAMEGADPKSMPTDPTLVEGAHITVREQAGYLEVVVRTRTVTQAQVALARARGELTQSEPEQTAIR